MMGKDLTPVGNSSAVAQVQVHQGGENNLQIAHADQVNPTQVQVYVPGARHLPSSTRAGHQAGMRPMDPSHYHLFVIGGEDFDSDRFMVDPTRALTEYTDATLKEQFARLEPDMINQLKLFPAIFASENALYGQAADGQTAYWGAVTDIRVQDNGIRIGFHIIHPIPQNLLNENATYLGINGYRFVNELNRTHWALKRVNLFEAFQDAGIPYQPYIIMGS